MEALLLLALVVWLSAALIVAVVIGRGIRLGDQRSAGIERALTAAALSRFR